MELLTTENLIAFLTLASLEIVLGIDNIVFIAILTGRLPESEQPRIRRIGIALAMISRIVLLFAISWVIKLSEPLFSIFDHGFSGRDLILIGGGMFLIGKSTFEMHSTIEGGHELATPAKGKAKISAILMQIIILDLVFSLDSVITAVGMVDHVQIMVAAVVASVAVMLLFATPVSHFVMRHPTVKMLALSFLMLIGLVLVADGWGKHIEKGYVYFAMGFSVFVEILNLRLRKKSSAKT